MVQSLVGEGKMNLDQTTNVEERLVFKNSFTVRSYDAHRMLARALKQKPGSRS